MKIFYFLMYLLFLVLGSVLNHLFPDFSYLIGFTFGILSFISFNLFMEYKNE